uniref:Uncharacterized protein n=1 Tax=Caenorhabditis japonica TaxID=281687 RepID=A0A8R1DTU2_CAEJA
MESTDFAATDSGYPTPRDDVPSSSRSASPPSSPDAVFPMTSTPVRQGKIRPMKSYFSNFRRELSLIESEASTIEQSPVLEGVKSLLAVSKELKQKSRLNAELLDENETLRGENESLREENMTLREESRRVDVESEEKQDSVPIVPKLQLEETEQETVIPSENSKLYVQIKKELLSVIKSEEDRSIVETKLDHMIGSDFKPPRVYTATATIQVDTEKMDMEELDQLQSELEIKEKKNTDLKNRLFDFEALKAKFEENEEKLRKDLEKKLKASQEKTNKCEAKIEELELRLKKKAQEFKEVSAENKRLTNDRTTHDFELDELKVHSEEIDKQRKKLEERAENLAQDVRDLEEKLKKEQEENLKLEKAAKKANEKHESVVSELQTRATNALESLQQIQEENRKMLKENQYLSAAQQALLDSEMSLKSENSVINATLRNAQQQIAQLKQDLAEEMRKREDGEKDILDLELQNQQLEEDRRDAEELLTELKKGKLEIDHLRQQLQNEATEGEKLKTIREELLAETQKTENLNKELLNIAAEKADVLAKMEGYIRSEAAKEAEIEILKRDLEEKKLKNEELTEESKKAGNIFDDLKRAYKTIELEYEEFKVDANLQYNDQIGIRDQKIADLHDRLIQLESYPGQTISVARNNAETQTENEEPISAEISLVSEEHVPSRSEILERNTRELISTMTEFAEGRKISSLPPSFQNEPPPSYHSSDTFLEFADILEALLAGEVAPIEETRRFWKVLNRRMEGAEQLIEEKVNEAKNNAFRELERIDGNWKRRVEDLQEEMSKEKEVSEQRLELAEGFRQQYEIELHEKEKMIDDYGKLGAMYHEEVDNREAIATDLRHQLEDLQHKVQSMNREKLVRNEADEAEMERLQTLLEKTQRDSQHKVANAKKELEKEQRKRAYDKETMKTMKESFKMVDNKAAYYRKRNTERQKLINHMQKVMTAILQSGQNGGQSMKALEDLQEQLYRSGLTENDQSDAETQHPHGRRVLSEMNQTK